MKITATKDGYNIAISNEDAEVILQEMEITPVKKKAYDLFRAAANIKLHWKKSLKEITISEVEAGELRDQIRMIKKHLVK